MEPFALLEDRLANADRRASRLYSGFSHERRCEQPAELDPFWQEIEQDLARGLHAVLLIDYEWGVRLHLANLAVRDKAQSSVFRVLFFRQLEVLGRAECDAWLGDGAAAGVLEVAADISEAAFARAIAAIHEAIREGETYQINYTYRLQAKAYGRPIDLYRRLRARQPVQFGAFIQLPAGSGPSHVLSFSPELFLSKSGCLVEARPMKGTAPASGNPQTDQEVGAALAADAKNRAENLMIVDLLRNDLGRIAETGSVKVPQLFAIEHYATVLQMTSSVTAELAPGTAFPAVLRALFPCGSITGAPKHRAMQIIDALEASPRGLYTGAIGWFDAPGSAGQCGDFCLSVAIRTLTLKPEAQSGLWLGEMGVGAGIVIDSEADAEFAECQLKGRFLTGLEAGFALFETMLVTGGEIRHCQRHLARLARSAAALGFRFDRDCISAELAAATQILPANEDFRLRLQLEPDGTVSTTSVPLVPLATATVEVRLASRPIGEDLPLPWHKTTLRSRYEQELRAAESHRAFDTICFNAAGEITEGARSNIFVKLDGRWYTPPVSAGLLPGVMRSVLLDDPALAAAERTIDVVELRRAEQLIVCNALRGPVRALLKDD